MSFAERVRHPSGALDLPRRDRELSGTWWFWLLLALVVFVCIGWRAGWFRNGPPLPPAPLANPFGWK